MTFSSVLVPAASCLCLLSWRRAVAVEGRAGGRERRRWRPRLHFAPNHQACRTQHSSGFPPTFLTSQFSLLVPPHFSDLQLSVCLRVMFLGLFLSVCTRSPEEVGLFSSVKTSHRQASPKFTFPAPTPTLSSRPVRPTGLLLLHVQ